MKEFLEKIKGVKNPSLVSKLSGEEHLHRQVLALLDVLTSLYGLDKLVLRAGKLGAIKELKSTRLEDQILALQKLVFEDPTLETPPRRGDLSAELERLEEEVADRIAKRTVEDRIERKVAEKMEERHQEYVREIKEMVMREDGSVENAQTLKKYARLEKLNQRSLTRSVLEMLRPSSLEEVVGQERAVRNLRIKLASPYPQHVILYGPPGTGKTTAARLILEAAKSLEYSPFGKDAPFVEVDGTILRWDPREVTNPLLGSVHDPIYQGARRDLAEVGVPEPKPGLVTEAHGGVLFIDEIGEMDPMLQTKLLKVLEEKRVKFDSAYYDPDDPAVPKYVRKLFDEGAPADFVLIGATTRLPEEISPALRSRMAEVFFDPLNPSEIIKIVERGADRLGMTLEREVAGAIAQSTAEGRKAVGLLADMYGLALSKAGQTCVTLEEARSVIQSSRMGPTTLVRAADVAEVGKTFGLGVSGYLGTALEIEAVAFPARERGKGGIRFNETAGSMARDSVYNVASVIRRLTGEDLANYDLHVNVIGGGNIDGPSAGVAIAVAVYSAVTQEPVRQDVAFTGELSLRGRMRAVGGIAEKIRGAEQAEMKLVIVPAENQRDIPDDLREGIRVCPVTTVEEALDLGLGRGERMPDGPTAGPLA